MRVGAEDLDKNRGDAIFIMETNTPYHQLIALLETEIHLYGALKELIETESAALIAKDLDAIHHLLGNKQVLVDKLLRVEARRTDWLRAQGARAKAAGSPRLKTLIAHAPREVARRLERCRRELVDLTRDLKQRNHLHRKILNHSRILAEDALQLLGGRKYVQPTYQSNGNLSGAGKGGFVLSGLA
jgi:flagellar biosynthesis/type III secretory pathway chaperone